MASAFLHWFRRDLRLRDNPALHAAHRESGGNVIPVFIVSEGNAARHWSGPPRQAALCGSLRALAEGLAARGSHLVLRKGDAAAELEALLRETHAATLTYHRSPDPAGRALEARVETMARGLGVRVTAFDEVTALPPDAVLTQTGKPFRVFTPFARAWMRLEASIPAPLPAPSRFAPVPAALRSLPLPAPATWGFDTSAIALPAFGEPAAHRRMERFFREAVFRYADNRDLPALDATSRLSAALRWGTLSARTLVNRCRVAANGASTATQREGPRKFLGELIWREFYLAILRHFPDVLKREFQPRFRAVRWRGDGPDFQRWCEGTTGFPIVDAGMRQLAATGWMHNRVRMITAMFLTKDLHIDWRLGERFFMRHLADGEIASNNGGWQWSAGTGADAAPYFRIQNPWTQSARFDPEGDYIKMWVPELRDIPARALARPPAPGTPLAPGYPEPMVDHAREREVTLAMYHGG